MRIRKCAFCAEYNKQLEIDEIEKQRGYKMHLRVCLFTRSMTTSRKEHYATYSKPARLRYCPTCGKKLAN